MLKDIEYKKYQSFLSVGNYWKRYLLLLLCFLGAYVGELSAQSPMKIGKWARIAFEDSGLYVLEQKDLSALGLSSIEKVAVWGYGGGLMPEILGEVREHQLVQIPTLLRNGKLYFYVDGLTLWDYDAEDDFYHHRTNHYAKEAYVLLSEGTNDKPLRMQEEEVKLSPELSTKASQSYIQPIVRDYVVDIVIPSGRKLYTYPFYFYKSLDAKYGFSAPEECRMKLAYIANPKEGQEGIDFYLNGKKFFDSSISNEEVRQDRLYYVYNFKGIEKNILTEEIKLDPKQQQFNIEIKAQGVNKSLKIDYFEFNVLDRIVKLRGQTFLRRNSKGLDWEQEFAHYSIPQVDDVYLFALDREAYFGAYQTKLITYPKPLNNGSLELELRNRREDHSPRTYLALSLATARRPKLIGAEANQDILGDQRRIDLLMICTKGLKEEAKALQKHYEAKGQVVALWTEQEVFNAFNGGTADAMAYRLLVQHYYKLFKPNETKFDTAPFSLLLFGDAAHDNRLYSSRWVKAPLKNVDFLLSYQSVNSISLDSYSSDDFFGVMKDEGLSSYYQSLVKRRTSINFERDYIPNLAKETMDISVGRLPVRDTQEAKAVVNKIINYDNNNKVGLWKRNATFIADNGDDNSHTEQSIEIVEKFEEIAPMFKVQKVYLSSYQRELVNGEALTPDARADFHKAITQGTMLVNYNGHGSPLAWAKERLLLLDDIKHFTYPHLPLWITATCDFSPFDHPDSSGGEELILNPHSGGIALLSTTRTVWDIPNKILNKALIEELFSVQKDGTYLSLGEAIRRAKNKIKDKSSPENRLNFVLLGSPLQQLALPLNKVVISKFNDRDIEEGQELKMHALERIKFAGYIKASKGDIDGDFQGKVDIIVYDAEQEKETIDNFNDAGTMVAPVKYKEYSTVLYAGTVAVKDGQFSFDFVVPKDLAYSGGKGKIVLYAYDEKRQVDCQTYLGNLLIEAGSKASTEAEQDAPKILEMRLSNKELKPKMLVPEISELYVLIKEKIGLNLSNAGLGHQLRLEIDGAKGVKIDLSPYYSSSTKDGLGIIKLVLPRLSNGYHRAELRLCDIYNNVTKKSFDFIVREGLAPQIEELKVSMADGGRLLLKYDQTAMPLLADLKIFDASGRLLIAKKDFLLAPSSAYVAYSFESLGLDSLKALPKAVYILRLSLRSRAEKATIGSKAVKFFKP